MYCLSPCPVIFTCPLIVTDAAKCKSVFGEKIACLAIIRRCECVWWAFSVGCPSRRWVPVFARGGCVVREEVVRRSGRYLASLQVFIRFLPSLLVRCQVRLPFSSRFLLSCGRCCLPCLRFLRVCREIILLIRAVFLCIWCLRRRCPRLLLPLRFPRCPFR